MNQGGQASLLEPWKPEGDTAPGAREQSHQLRPTSTDNRLRNAGSEGLVGQAKAYGDGHEQIHPQERATGSCLSRKERH